MGEYKTVKGFAEAEYEEHHSRFISAVKSVSTEANALKFITERKAASFGAKHNVYAYILRENNTVRYSDDGEPHSTAGVPTLDVLRKGGITDCCIVTTRYFGGILLGTGGLVRAYTAVAKSAVETAGIAVMCECNLCSIACEYGDYENVRKVLDASGARITDTGFSESVKISFSVQTSDYSMLCDKISDSFCGRFKPNIESTDYAEV